MSVHIQQKVVILILHIFIFLLINCLKGNFQTFLFYKHNF